MKSGNLPGYAKTAGYWKRATGGAAALGLMALMLSGCFTGVEGTGKINLSKKDRMATAPTEEDRFISNIAPDPIGRWEKGRAFIVADEKFRLIAEGQGHSGINAGDTLLFYAVESASSADGGERTALSFKANADNENATIGYTIEKPLEIALREVTASEIPMLIDTQTVHSVKDRLLGRTLWVKTALWYGPGMQYKKGRKFEEVKVTDVKSGNAFFPVAVEFETPEGDSGSLMMNIGNSGNGSRNFGKLFSLTNPRNLYKHITEENWEAIKMEEVRLGMTKEECKIAIGNPSDVTTGHNYSNAVEIWQYADGRVLRFVDGILVR